MPYKSDVLKNRKISGSFSPVGSTATCLWQFRALKLKEWDCGLIRRGMVSGKVYALLVQGMLFFCCFLSFSLTFSFSFLSLLLPLFYFHLFSFNSSSHLHLCPFLSLALPRSLLLSFSFCVSIPIFTFLFSVRLPLTASRSESFVFWYA